MKNNTKILAIITFIVLAVYLILSAIAGNITVMTILQFIAMLLVGLAILRDNNDTFTLISIIIGSLLTGNIVFLIMYLVRKYAKSEKTRNTIEKIWFLPGIIHAIVLMIITWSSASALNSINSLYTSYGSLLSDYSFDYDIPKIIIITIVSALLLVVFSFIISYWGLKQTDNKSASIVSNNNDIAYLDSLLASGTITQEEYNEKLKQLIQK